MNETEIEYLDILIRKGEGKYICSTFQKPISRNSYILFSSCHLPRWLLNIPTGQFGRLKRNCTKMEQFEKEAENMKMCFLDKKYPIDIVEKSLCKIREKDRKSFFEKGDDKDKDKNNTSDNLKDGTPRIILPFNPEYKKVERIIRRYWHHIREDKTIGALISQNPQFVYTKARNLGCKIAPTTKQTQIKKKGISQYWDHLKGFFRCGKCSNCKQTTFPRKTIEVQSVKNNFKIEISDLLTCNSDNVLYLIQCPCGKQYIGRTKRLLKTRIAEHIGNIKKGYEKHVLSRHFKQYHNQNPSGLVFVAFEKINKHWRGGDHISRMSRQESRRIFEFDSIQPNGLNAELEIFGFL